MGHEHARSTRLAVLVPVKGFRAAKQRLGDVLSVHDRIALARSMADGVMRAAGPLPVAVVCADEEVEAWARAHGALVIPDPLRGLSAAAEHGVRLLRDDGFERVIVVHADLPRARSLQWVGDFDGITLVPDRHGDGTNVIAVPTATGFSFAYGPGSFARHEDEARRSGVPVRIARDRDLAFDIDTAADLDIHGCVATLQP